MVQSSITHRIGLLKAELAALQPMGAEAENALWKKLRLEWNYNSNHIEGNTLTYGETKLLLIFGTTTGDHSKREYDEMEAHDAAIMLVQQWAKDKERMLSEADIRELNRVILVKPYWKEALTPAGNTTSKKIKIGEYKDQPNSVLLPNGEMFEYAKPEDVPMLMQELMDWYRSGEVTDPIVLAAELHYRFIRIHPFDDGNGRVARLLVNYVLMLHDLPPVVIKSAEKRQYLTALQKADVGDREAFHAYMAEQLIWSLELTLKAAKGEDLEEEGDVDKKISILKKKVSGSGKAKSPKLAYHAYRHVAKGVWPLVEEIITDFEDLFSEKRIEEHIDGMAGQEKRSSVFSAVDMFSDKVVSVEENDPKILGHKLYGLDLEDADWVAKLYGLKGGRESTSIDVKAQLTFNTKDYKLSFILNNETVFDLSANYETELIEDDVQIGTGHLKRALFKEIEKRVEGQTK